MEQKYIPRPKVKISSKAKSFSTIIGTLLFITLLVILWVNKVQFCVSEADVHCLLEISAGLAAFSLAVPTFLRDRGDEDCSWNSFLIVAIIFFIASIIGFATTLVLQDEVERAELQFTGFIIVLVLVILHTFLSFLTLYWLRRINMEKIISPESELINIIGNRLNFSQGLEYLIVAFITFGCFILGKGIPAAFILIFSYGIIMLTSVLGASLLTERMG